MFKTIEKQEIMGQKSARNFSNKSFDNTGPYERFLNHVKSNNSSSIKIEEEDSIKEISVVGEKKSRQRKQLHMTPFALYP